VLGGAVGLIASQATLAPFVDAPAVVDYEDRLTVRAGTSGFIEEIAVTEGQTVEPGDLLVRLTNPELEVGQQVKARSLDAERLRLARLLSQADIAGYQAKADTVAALEAELAELQARIQELNITAETAGTVLAGRIGDRLGTFAPRGEELLSIVSAEHKLVRVSVDSRDIAVLRADEDAPIELRFPGRGGEVFRGNIQGSVPRASDRIDHPALVATNGGLLPVRPGGDGSANLRHLNPRVLLRVRLEADKARLIRAGEVGVARLPSVERPLIAHLRDLAGGWFDYLFQSRMGPMS
jgi:multidrug efflux pump subunit AcrA (membrane-fusion protein)